MTALRWACLWRQLGHRPFLESSWSGRPCDVLVALHGDKSATSVSAFHQRYPERPVVVGLAGTDLYREGGLSSATVETLERATRIVALQPRALERLRDDIRSRCRVIYQSSSPPPSPAYVQAGRFEVCVIANWRKVKNPFLAARAVRKLPSASRIHVDHIGARLSDFTEEEIRAEERTNPRFTWLGPLSHRRTLDRLARARLLIAPSLDEGGANVLSEAIACQTPVLASHIPGSIGILGADYPGFFRATCEEDLARLLWKAESQRPFYARLVAAIRSKAWVADPARERSAWRELLAEITTPSSP